MPSSSQKVQPIGQLPDLGGIQQEDGSRLLAELRAIRQELERQRSERRSILITGDAAVSEFRQVVAARADQEVEL